MPGWAATLLVCLANLILQGFLLAYFFGKLSQRVNEHDKELASIDGRFKGIADDERRQWSELNLLGKGLEKVKGVLGINGS